MAEVKEPNEPTLPAKRKQADPLSPDNEELDQPNKTPKIQSSNSNHRDSPPAESGKASSGKEFGGKGFAPIFSIPAEDAGKGDKINGIEVDEEEGDEEEEEDGEVAVVDRKGKGIMIEEDEDSEDDSDDDDSSDDDDNDGSENGGGDDDSDLEDDPLAEVDLDNILPSRTRRRGVQPGFYIANDPGIADEDDSDDSDA